MSDHHPISSLRFKVPESRHSSAVSPRSISRLQRRNLAKLKSKWSDIIARYSNIDDASQSDEIDLATGLITINNGHLSSLSNDRRGIWNAPDDHLPLPLHPSSHLHHSDPSHTESLWADDYPLASHSSDSSPTKRLIDDSSPTKRLKFTSSGPAKHHNTDHHTLYALDHPSHDPSSSQHDSFLDADNVSPSKVPPSTGHDQISPIKQRRTKSIPRETLVRPNPDSSKLSRDPLTPISLPLDTTDSFDSNYHIVEDPFGLAGYDLTRIYSCALDGCSYCTGNCQLYKKHLLANHSCEIAALGYPTKLRTGLSRIPSPAEAQRLLEHFPLSISVPDSSPVSCGMNLSGGPCQHASLDPLQMQAHRAIAPQNCFSGTFVYLCPILGCGFMTEHGFDDWRQHVLEHCPTTLKSDSAPSDVEEVSGRGEWEENLISRGSSLESSVALTDAGHGEIDVANTATDDLVGLVKDSARDSVKHEIPGPLTDGQANSAENGIITRAKEESNSQVDFNSSEFVEKKPVSHTRADPIDLRKGNLITDAGNSDLKDDPFITKGPIHTTTVELSPDFNDKHGKPPPAPRSLISHIDLSAIPLLSPPSNSPLDVSFPILSDNVQDLFSDCEWDLPNDSDSDGSLDH